MPYDNYEHLIFVISSLNFPTGYFHHTVNMKKVNKIPHYFDFVYVSYVFHPFMHSSLIFMDVYVLLYSGYDYKTRKVPFI